MSSAVSDYSQEERSEIAKEIVASLKDAEAGLWCIHEADLARAARDLIDDLEGAFSGR